MADWVGAVLTGGASTRMGRDKAGIRMHGATMADRVAQALRAAGAAAVVRVGGAAGDIADDHPGEGPLGAILTAARWAGGRPVVVAPCDLLAPERAALAALAHALETDGVAVAVPAPGRPLPIALAPAGVDALARAFAAGERSVHRAVASSTGVVAVAIDERSLADADTPGQLPPEAR